MSRLLGRVVLAALLAGTVAVKLVGPEDVEFDIRTAVGEALTHAGAKERKPAEKPAVETLTNPMYFDVPGCDAPLQVVPVSLNLQESALFDKIVEAGYRRKFVYLEGTWPQLDRFGMRLEWLKAKAQAGFWRGRYVTVATALLVAEPSHCRSSEMIDWPSVWVRRPSELPGGGQDGARG